MKTNLKNDYKLTTAKLVTNNKVKLNNLYKKMYYDKLTGLYNREYIILKATEVLKEHENQIHALFILDLDGFKQINDSFGHNIGDEVLIKVGECIKYTIRSTDYAGRMGGDEYVIFLPNIKSEATAYKIANEIYMNLSSLTISNTILQNIYASIGVSLSSLVNNNYDSLYKSADIALSNAKNSEQSVIINCQSSALPCDSIEKINQSNTKLDLFLQDVALKINRNPEYVKKVLYEALLNNEFEIYLQAKYNTETASFNSAEVLARWKSKKYGMVMPMNFIYLLERLNLIKEFDYYILNKSMELLSSWQKKGYTNFNISINQNAHLITTLGYVKSLKLLIEKFSLNPKNITIEITERSQLTTFRTLIVVAERLRKLGIKLSIDDFGSGNTSLNMIKQVKVDEIKLDQMFMQINNENKERSKIIIENLLKMAQELNIITVAEGVETKLQAHFLSNLGCDYLQGFAFSKPCTIANFEKKYLKK